MVRESISIELLWKGSERYQMRIPKYATVLSIKVLIEELTEIEADSQKLLGLVKGRLPSDGDTLVSLGVRNGTRVRLMGTRMADRLKFDAKNAWGEPEDTGVTGISSGADPVDRASGSLRRGHGRSRVVSDDWKHSLAKIVSDASLRVLNAPRPGKKLAVLDLDYTLFDCKNITGNVADMARPGLHEFLAAIYPHYDLIVWSQTRWHVLESKITLLGMLTHPLYRITTALDISTMFTVKSIRNGELGTHQHYSSQNTIHIDDLSRNFALNYQNGLKIRPFKRADTQPRSDTELFRLARYLLKIARLESLDELDHSSWHSYK
ncbi:ubiquitin-like domain-containing CTD phosphatase 1-like protein [Kickxella alabastrina]|uniref:ubiquitin-like domain-containing CTD phosphatase 1-like protein n=1 Tax=Kickxella alabastrina TaxID=61397 RepID=UPI00221F8AD5|nr:ubiquitin-like domain-containing CTD phosphatase 1-like protein [Kickxella alabastrina]KAI7822429.1 ubiquitin-like domain-containing CTD phosphatase 1-like protein [Kickxella alabastrina]